MTRRWPLAVLLLVCAAQLAVPVLMIRKYEATLAHGRPFKVRCAPVDPADAFRGRYVWLSLEVRAPEAFDAGDLEWGKRLWASLEEGEDGFARAAAIHEQRPDGGDIVPVHYAGGGWWPGGEAPEPPEIRFRLGIDRWYMPEALAPEAERAYREAARPGTLDAHAAVRVLDGTAVIEGLFVAGMAIEAYIALPRQERDRLLTPVAQEPLDPGQERPLP